MPLLPRRGSTLTSIRGFSTPVRPTWQYTKCECLSFRLRIVFTFSCIAAAEVDVWGIADLTTRFDYAEGERKHKRCRAPVVDEPVAWTNWLKIGRASCRER